MVLLTMIARVADGLPLAASMQEDEQVSYQVLATPNPCQSALNTGFLLGTRESLATSQDSRPLRSARVSFDSGEITCLEEICPASGGRFVCYLFLLKQKKTLETE